MERERGRKSCDDGGWQKIRQSVHADSPCWEDPWDLPESLQSSSSVLFAHLLHASPAACTQRHKISAYVHLSTSLLSVHMCWTHPSPSPGGKLVQCTPYSLYNHLQGLSQRNRFVVKEVEVQLVAEVRGGFQKSVELLLHHFIFFFWHLGTHVHTMSHDKDTRLSVTLKTAKSQSIRIT